MNVKLFKKVNKRRGRELKVVLHEMKHVFKEIEKYHVSNYKFIEGILDRIDLKSEKYHESNYINIKEILIHRTIDQNTERIYTLTDMINELFKEIVYNISSTLDFIGDEMDYFFDCTEDEVEEEKYEDEEFPVSMTDKILQLYVFVKDGTNILIAEINEFWNMSQDPIKRKKIYNDIYYVICVLKEFKTNLLKMIKNFASLYVRD